MERCDRYEAQIGLAKLHKDVVRNPTPDEAESWRSHLLSWCLMVLLVLSPLHVGVRTAFAAAALGRVVRSKL